MTDMRLSQTLHQLEAIFKDKDTACQAKSNELEARIKFIYDLKAYVESGLRGKWDSVKMLEEIKNKLNGVCPHGPDNKVE